MKTQNRSNQQNFQRILSILWRAIIILVVLFQTGAIPAKAATSSALLNATYNTHLWETVVFDEETYEIWLVLDPDESIPPSDAPLLYDQHNSSIESIYITSNGVRVDDPSLEFEIIFLAQNNLLLEDQSDWEPWVTGYSTQSDGELVNINVNSVTMPMFIPKGVNPDNGTKDDVIDVLSDYDKRVDLYAQLIRKITHPGLEVSGVYEIEDVFDDEMGWVYEYAMWYANNSEFDKLTEKLPWFGMFAEGMQEGTKAYCETYYVAVEFAPRHLQNMYHMSKGLNIAVKVLEVLDVTDHQLDALTRYMATVIYVQSRGYERLDAFEWAVDNYPHADKDPALEDAIVKVNGEFDSLLSVSVNMALLVWAPFFSEIFANYHPDSVSAFIDLAALIGGISWAYIIPQPYGIMVGAAWTSAIILWQYFAWADQAPDLIAMSGLALELEYIMEETLKDGFTNRNLNADLAEFRPLVLSINQRYFAGYLFYKILLERYRTNDDLYNQHWFIPEEAPQNPGNDGNLRLENFSYTLPLPYIETHNVWVGAKTRGPAITDITPINITDINVGSAVPIRVQFIVNSGTEKVDCFYSNLNDLVQYHISTDTSATNGWGCDWNTAGITEGIYLLDVLVTDSNDYSKFDSTAVRLIGQQLPVISDIVITPNQSQYDPGETVLLAIEIDDDDNLSVTGATLSFSIDGTAYSCSDSGVSCNEVGGGEYNISFPAPSAIRDYPVEVTASKSGYLPGTGTTTITVNAPFELGHDVDVYFFIAEKSGSQVRAQANVKNIGTYAGTTSDTIRLVYRLKDPSGNIVDTDNTQVFALAKNDVGYSAWIYLNDPGGFDDGQYIVEVEAEIVGQTDQYPSNNKKYVSLWYGTRPSYSEYGLGQSSAAEGSITSPSVDGYTLEVVSISSTSGYARINVFKNGSSVSDCQLERAYRDQILTCDNNNLAIILNVITSSVPKQAWFYLGKANNTGVTFTPGTAITPAGLEAYFHVTGPSGVDLGDFLVEYDGPNDDFPVVSTWALDDDRNQDNDWDVTLEVPASTSANTYDFWMAFDDDNSDFYRIIKKLAVEIQPPHNIVVSSVSPNSQTITVGAVVPIETVIQNSGGYTEYGLNAIATITGPNGYVQTYNQTISSLSSGSPTTRTFNWPTSGLIAGTYTIKVEVPFSLDAYPSDNIRTVTNALSSPPTLTVNATTDKTNYVQGESISLSATVTANSSSVSGALVTYFIKDSGNQTISSGQLPDQTNGVYTSPIPAPLGISTYSITVSATKSGYVNGSDQITGIDITTAPPVTTLLTISPAEGELINYNDLAFTWMGTDITAPANQLEYAYKLDSNPWSSFGTSTSISYTDLAEGTHTFNVKTRVIGGLEDPTPANRSFAIDTLAPVFETTPTANAPIYQNTDTIQIQIGLDSQADVNASFNAIDSNFNPGNITVTETNPSSHTYLIVYPVSANNSYSDNQYSINIYATDAAGNTRTNSSLHVRLDNSSPTILAKDPDSGEVATLDTDVSVLFSEAMSKTSVESAFSIQPQIDGTLIWNGNTMAFTPVSGWLCETNYAVEISSSATDLVGKALSPSSWTFTTQSCGNPVPSISSINPSSAIPGGTAFTLTVNGANFVSGSQVRWNEADRPTTYVSNTQLTASITAADIASVGTAMVTVFNPSPGGGTSGGVTFTIASSNPVPTLSNISPISRAAGSGAFTLTVNGTNFVGNSKVHWNGAERATTYVSATQLTASITAADIASAGAATVTVFNQAPGGGESGEVTFTINPPATAPEIDIKGNNVSIPSGSTTPTTSNHTDFGSVAVASGTVSRTFTILNTGNADLSLIGTPKVVVNGADVSDFTVNPQPSSPIISPSGSITFTVIFDPSGSGPRTATISISNNDTDENPYNFAIQGTGADISTEKINFEEFDTGQIEKPLVIDGVIFDTWDQNCGDLYIGYWPSMFNSVGGLDGSKALEYTMYCSWAPGYRITLPRLVDAASFDVKPYDQGLPNTLRVVAYQGGPNGTPVFDEALTVPGLIMITSTQDFDFLRVGNLQSGSGVGYFSIDNFSFSKGPEIGVEGNGIPIQNGNITPAPENYTDFGSVNIGSTVSHTFTIYNTGAADLNLTSSPRVSISGSHASDFSVSAQPSSPVADGSSTTFTIVFDPDAAGLRTATISIANNDEDENPYTFAIQGTGIAETVIGWQYTSSLVTPRYVHGVARWDNYIYVLGGEGSGANLLSSIERASINPDGSLSAWQTIGQLSSARNGLRAIAVDGHLYVVGGNTASGRINTVEHAVINPDGSLGNWQSTSSMLTARAYFGLAVANGYMYAIGGSGVDSALSSVEYAPIQPDGSLGSWQAATGLNIPRQGTDAMVVNGYLYIPSGSNVNGKLTSAEYASIQPDGSLAAWQTSSGINTARVYHAAVTDGRMMYLIGGTAYASNDGIAFVERAEIGSNHLPGPWQTFHALKRAKFGATSVYANGFIYATGGYIYEGYISDVEYIQVAPGIATPEMDVRSNETSIASGDTSPSVGDGTDFGSVDLGSESATSTFSVYNLGGADLLLTGSPKVQLSGANADDFMVSVQPSGVVMPGGSTVFQVTFVPTAAGVRTATISIANNDEDENPYTFAVQGFGLANPSPTVSSINPTSATAGGSSFTLTVTGSNFIDGSKVRWNGTDRTTTYVSSTQLTASITVVDIASAGTATVTVFNPTPGGGTSAGTTFTILMPSPCVLTWQTGIHVTDNGNLSDTLTVGLGPNATDGLDTNCGEEQAPPLPPSGGFDARLVLPGGAQESLKDFRSDSLTQADWQIKFQPGTGGYPFTITWDSDALPSGTFRLKDLFGGTVVDVDMKAQNSYVVSNVGISALKIEYRLETCVDVNVTAGWNMRSVPVQAANMQLSTLYPDITPPAYYYTNAYQPVQASGLLQPGRGYWMYFTEPHSYQICGDPVSPQDIVVNAGWNMIGPFENAVAVSALSSTPASILTPPLYGYTNAYVQASTLNPGTGYWAYMNQVGTLHMTGSGGALRHPELEIPGALSRLPQDFRLPVTVTRGENTTTVYIGVASGGSNGYDIGLDQLAPPPAPNGVFDVRLRGDGQDYLMDVRSSTEGEQTFNLSYTSAEEGEPIVISWDPAVVRRLGSFQITDGINGGLFALDMNTTGELLVEADTILAGGLAIHVNPALPRYAVFLPVMMGSVLYTSENSRPR